jgi:hypothetical protein
VVLNVALYVPSFPIVAVRLIAAILLGGVTVMTAFDCVPVFTVLPRMTTVPPIRTLDGRADTSIGNPSAEGVGTCADAREVMLIKAAMAANNRMIRMVGSSCLCGLRLHRGERELHRTRATRCGGQIRGPNQGVR